jgi:hypothetical protein
LWRLQILPQVLRCPKKPPELRQPQKQNSLLLQKLPGKRMMEWVWMERAQRQLQESPFVSTQMQMWRMFQRQTHQKRMREPKKEWSWCQLLQQMH